MPSRRRALFSQINQDGMRIGFDAKRAFANKTGLGNYSRFVLDALRRNEPGHAYRAYTPKNQRDLFPDFPPENIGLPAHFLDKKLSAWWRYSGITAQLAADKIDVFHGLSNELPKGLHKAGIASVVTIHDLIFEKLPALFNPIDRLIYRHKFQSACRRADRVIAISDQTRRDLISIYNVPDKKISVIYQDCNPIFSIPVPDEDQQRIAAQYGLKKPFVLCVGTLEERKNQLRLAEAFAHLSSDVDLVLVGKPTKYAEKISAFIADKKLADRIRILTNVPTAHLPALYQRASVFAYISIYEGFGIPIVEALRSGTPVLAARGSCLEEAGGPGGRYVDPNNIAEVADKLRILLADSALRQQLTAAGQVHVQQFEGSRIAAQLTQLYTEIA